MNRTVDALKTLYVALGGTTADVADITTIPEILTEIIPLAATIAEGSAAELPTVTSSNNGEILTVSGGKWVSAAPASQLPAVTATENGEVLTVVEGAWAAANLPT